MSGAHSNNNDDDDWAIVPSQRRQRPKRPPLSAIPTWLTDFSAKGHEEKSTRFMLLLVGLPGSGKSTVADALVHARPDRFVRINQDTLGNRRACEQAAERAMQQEGMCPIVDRCNFDPKQRRPFVDLAAKYGYAVDGLVLDVPPSVCLQRCRNRPNHPTVAPHEAGKIIGFVEKDWESPNLAKESFFRRLWTVQMDAADEQQLQLREIMEVLVNGE